jgi:hypothetical protein
MNDNYYPQEISEDEASLSFRHLLIDGIGVVMGSQIDPHPVPVVARVLSTSDVLIKIRPKNDRDAYSHQRFGYSEITSYRGTQWQPVSTPVSDARKLISDFNGGVHKETFPNKIQRASFDCKEATPSDGAGGVPIGPASICV